MAIAVCTRAAPLGIEKINVFVFANKSEFDNPRSVIGTNYRLEYLGEFQYNTRSANDSHMPPN